VVGGQDGDERAQSHFGDGRVMLIANPKPSKSCSSNFEKKITFQNPAKSTSLVAGQYKGKGK